MNIKRILIPLLLILFMASMVAFGAPVYVNVGPTTEFDGDIKIISEIVAEGTTPDNWETTVFFTDPTADNTITIPDYDVTVGSAILLTVTLNDATAENNAILFTSGGVGAGVLNIESDIGDFYYTPSTGTVTATAFSGDGSALTGVGSAATSALTAAVRADEDLKKGDPVFISGALGAARSKVQLIDADDPAKIRMVGAAATDIANGADGLIRTYGLITAVDTLGATDANPNNEAWVAGQLLYATLDGGGGYTWTRPTSGRVIKAAFSFLGAHNADTLFIFSHENPVAMACAVGEDILIRMGDSIAGNKVQFKDYANAEVAFIDSDGKADFTSLTLDTALLIAEGGTNSAAAIVNDRVMVSSAGGIISSATITTTELALLNGLGNIIVTDNNACTDLEGTKLSIGAGVLNCTETDSAVGALTGIILADGGGNISASAVADTFVLYIDGATNIPSGEAAFNYVKGTDTLSVVNITCTTVTGALAGNATTASTAAAGDAAVDFFGAGVDAVTDATECTDIEGTGLSIAGGVLNWACTVNGIDSDNYTDGSIDHEHLAVDIIHGWAADTLADADEFIFYDENGADLNKITWTNLMGSITKVGTIATGTWQGTVIAANYGGTGVANNVASTITITGNFATTITVSNVTTITLPISGTLYGTKTDSITSANLLGSLTNETGTGVLVFGTDPVITTKLTIESGSWGAEAESIRFRSPTQSTTDYHSIKQYISGASAPANFLSFYINDTTTRTEILTLYGDGKACLVPGGGNVGIGTSAPSGNLDINVATDADPHILLSENDATKWDIYNDHNDDALQVKAGATLRYEFGTDGTADADVAWGTFSPIVEGEGKELLAIALEDANKPVKPYVGIPVVKRDDELFDVVFVESEELMPEYADIDEFGNPIPLVVITQIETKVDRPRRPDEFETQEEVDIEYEKYHKVPAKIAIANAKYLEYLTGIIDAMQEKIDELEARIEILEPIEK